MIYKAAVLSTLLVAGGAVSGSARTPVDIEEDTSEFYTDITSVSHPAKLLKSNRDHRKWVKFPEQLSAHATALKDRTRNLRAKKTDLSVVSHKDFFKTHAATFGLSDKVEMMVKDISPMTRTKTVRQRYEQYYDGVRVLTGDFIVSVGAHEGVLNAHGSSFSDRALKHTIADFERIKAKKADIAAIHANVKDVLLKEKGRKSAAASSVDVDALKEEIIADISVQMKIQSRTTSAEAKAAPAVENLTERDIELRDVTVELVVHPEWIGRGLTDSSLAYFVEGTAIVKGAFVSFQVSLDADSLESRLFIDQTNRVVSTPTSGVKVKNRDDYDVNLFTVDSYVSDPEHIWSSGNPSMPKPPTAVGEYLVDVSMMTSNLLYSLSGGEYLGWNYTDTMMNVVQIDFDYQNAFFDGQWGIWFGPGLETNDVIGHEWGHGYTQTMNNLFYYEDSGALNEAFSDVIGESVDLLSTTSSPRSPTSLECSAGLGGSDPSERWLMGEETIFGPIRDMYMPECADHPSNIRSALYDFYWCFDGGDGYGVHTNSGVMNKVFSTLADGGYQFVTQMDYDTVSSRYSKGIGMTKALNLIFDGYANLNMFSVYQDAAASIETQCELLEAATGYSDVYKPNLKDRTLKMAGSFSSSACNRVKKILKRAYLYEDPINFRDCMKMCDYFPNVCGDGGFSGSYDYSYPSDP